MESSSAKHSFKNKPKQILLNPFLKFELLLFKKGIAFVLKNSCGLSIGPATN